MSISLDLKDIWSVNKHNFNDIALELFRFQAKSNAVYAQYLSLIDKSPASIHKSDDIPFLPISFFKTADVRSYPFKEETSFKSSSTTGMNRSVHHIPNLRDYLENSEQIFTSRFGKLKDLEIYGLLPNYLEQGDSSLVAMVDHFIKKSKTNGDGFFLYDHAALIQRIEKSRDPLVLFGVSYALLDLASSNSTDAEFTIIETGGMKGRKKEITKMELYQDLRSSFPNAKIHSEYGMTELMSQAYTSTEQLYSPPAWMRVSTRLDSDPLSTVSNGRGALNIIDLANIHSCAFIATDDLGILHDNGSFEVLGRLDHADVRGCSQLAL